MKKHTFIIGVISSFFLIAGIVLKHLHLAGGNNLIFTGALVFLFGFGISLLRDRLTLESRRAYWIGLILLFTSIALMLLNFVFRELHLPGATEIGYTGLISFIVFAVYFNRQVEGRKLRLRKDRQLASILFTDIIGFTKMMGQDEYETIQVLEENRKTQKRLIRKYRGRWIKEIGDGTLSIFYTASEAILCGLELQSIVRQRKLYNIRMGIHVSEIVFTDSDIFGDGVNVASRVSDYANAGEICFTEPVFHNIRNREDLKIISVGRHELKNVGYSLELYKIEAS